MRDNGDIYMKGKSDTNILKMLPNGDIELETNTHIETLKKYNGIVKNLDGSRHAYRYIDGVLYVKTRMIPKEKHEK